VNHNRSDPSLSRWPVTVTELIDELEQAEIAASRARRAHDQVALGDARRRRRAILAQLELAKLQAMAGDGVIGTDELASRYREDGR
jgi:hypothetical protein